MVRATLPTLSGAGTLPRCSQAGKRPAEILSSVFSPTGVSVPEILYEIRISATPSWLFPQVSGLSDHERALFVVYPSAFGYPVPRDVLCNI